jgi:hypothetical protein
MLERMGIFDWMNGKRQQHPAPTDPEAEVRPISRTCLLPVTEEGESVNVVSKFCGSAWLGPSEAWPACGFCSQPMQLFVQLLIADTDEQLRKQTGDGLLQLFVCTWEVCDGLGNLDPFAGNSLARMIPVGALRAGGIHERPAAEEATYPSRLIVGWRQAIDYTGRYEERPYPLECEKIGGWPKWVQDEAEVMCPHCDTPMPPVLQIGSLDNIPYMFGDSGVGHVHVCAKHPETAGFRWDSC